MSRLADLLIPENVLLDLDVGNKRRLFEVIALESELRYDLAPSITVDSLLARERLGSTGLGQGIAIPHGRIRGLQHAIGYFETKKPDYFSGARWAAGTRYFCALGARGCHRRASANSVRACPAFLKSHVSRRACGRERSCRDSRVV